MTYSQDCRGSGCIGNMARYFLLICALGLQIGSSAEMPPRVSGCRQIHKAKPPADAPSTWTSEYVFRTGAACAASVVLQATDLAVVNVTDPRNCENFYKCQGLSVLQCPCPPDQTFNPVTLRCDNSNALCECQKPTTRLAEATTTTTIITDIAISVISAEETTRPEIELVPGVGKGTTEGQQTGDSTNGVVIIVVIVVLTVVILVALIIGFCLWQRGVFPLNKKPNMHSSNNDGYLHTLPPQERHVYAEIDERTVGQAMHDRRLSEEARRQLQHIYAPPMPSNPPTCIHHPHETFVLPATHQQRLYPQFAGYPVQSQQLSVTTNRDLIRFSASSPENKGNFSQNNNQGLEVLGNGYCADCTNCNNADNSSETSCSGCSHCSAASSSTQLENQEGIDRRNLLKYSHSIPPHTQFNFVSKQEYV